MEPGIYEPVQCEHKITQAQRRAADPGFFASGLAPVGWLAGDADPGADTPT